MNSGYRGQRGGGNGDSLFTEYRVSVWDDGKVLERDKVPNATDLYTDLYTVVSLMLHIFHYNKTKFSSRYGQYQTTKRS